MTVRVINGQDLPPILWMRSSPDDVRMWHKPGGDGMRKPFGGLWTAPVSPHPDGGDEPWTEWASYCYEAWGISLVGSRFIEISARPNTVFAVLDTLDDERDLAYALREPRDAPGIAWSRVPDRFDGVFLTDNGVRNQTLAGSYASKLLGQWDCPTVWFARPVYELGGSVPVTVPRSSS